MRLIDADALMANKFKNAISYNAFVNLVKRQPTIEPEKCIVLTLSEEQIREAVEKAKNEIIQVLPSAEPEVIRCKDCKYGDTKPIADGRLWCNRHNAYMKYCSDVERRTDERFDQQTGGD